MPELQANPDRVAKVARYRQLVREIDTTGELFWRRVRGTEHRDVTPEVWADLQADADTIEENQRRANGVREQVFEMFAMEEGSPWVQLEQEISRSRRVNRFNVPAMVWIAVLAFSAGAVLGTWLMR